VQSLNVEAAIEAKIRVTMLRLPFDAHACNIEAYRPSRSVTELRWRQSL